MIRVWVCRECGSEMNSNDFEDFEVPNFCGNCGSSVLSEVKDKPSGSVKEVVDKNYVKRLDRKSMIDDISVTLKKHADIPGWAVSYHDGFLHILSLRTKQSYGFWRRHYQIADGVQVGFKNGEPWISFYVLNEFQLLNSRRIANLLVEKGYKNVTVVKQYKELSAKKVRIVFLHDFDLKIGHNRSYTIKELLKMMHPNEFV